MSEQNKKRPGLHVEVIEENDLHKLEIIGEKNLYTLYKFDKKTKVSTRVSVAQGTTFEKFKKGCEKFKTKK